MKTFSGFLLFLVLLIPCTGHSQNLLNGPQKIVVDSKRNRLLVSNFNTGALVQIDSLGNQSYLVQSAGFVDGLEIVGDTVYGVGNNRKIRAYDLVTNQLAMDTTIPGAAANYLSSIAYDSAGHLFISCPQENVIYRMRISDRMCWQFASNNGLNKPNGILLEKEKNRIVVIDDSPGTSLIHAISLADSSVSTLYVTSFNRPDGITRDKFGYHYIGGYYLPGIYITDAGFSQDPELFFAGNNIVYPTYDKSDHSLLITHYNANTWERVPLTTTGVGPEYLNDRFVLYPVSPNPFKTGATVRFALNRSFPVRLDVYDSTGILVKTLVNEEKGPGTYDVAWETASRSVTELAPGFYYFRMTVNGITRTQKALLIR